MDTVDENDFGYLFGDVELCQDFLNPCMSVDLHPA